MRSMLLRFTLLITENFFGTIVSVHPSRSQGYHPDAPVATVRMLTELSSSCFSLIGTERALERVAIGTYQTSVQSKLGQQAIALLNYALQHSITNNKQPEGTQ